MKTKIILLAFILFAFSISNAQNNDKVYAGEAIEQLPEYPGGYKALMEYLSNIPYPPAAIENHIEGSVYVRFIIEKDGTTSNFEIAKGADPVLNDATIEWLKQMPAWKPGKQSGNPVRVQYILPIKFVLGGNEDDKDKEKRKKKNKG